MDTASYRLPSYRDNKEKMTWSMAGRVSGIKETDIAAARRAMKNLSATKEPTALARKITKYENYKNKYRKVASYASLKQSARKL